MTDFTDIQLPQCALVERNFPDLSIGDVGLAVSDALDGCGVATMIRPGASIAITAGSRGIDRIAEVLKAVGEYASGLGAKPFIVPAMGSHGGATAEGQVELLAQLGITEKSVNLPIHSSMQTVEVTGTKNGTPVHMDRMAFEADGIIAVNRVKPHTTVTGGLGSGLCKMLVVGLGKRDGATAFHSAGPPEMEKLLPEMAKAIIDCTPVICGIGLVEDSNDRLSIVRAATPETIMKLDVELLAEARRLMPRLPFDEIDVLVVMEIGKNVSGTGMDSNVIGRSGMRLVPDPPSPRIRRIVALDLTPETKGNAYGIGMADATTRRLAEKIDWAATRANATASAFPEKCALPLVFDADREAIVFALKTAWLADPIKARMVVVRNTLSLDRMLVSESLLDGIDDPTAVIGKPALLHFYGTGDLSGDIFRT